MLRDIKKVRSDFPILERKVNGYPVVYLDNAATSQKPKQVINAISNFYKKHNANVHRGIHTLSVEATEAMEDSRARIANFIGAKESAEVVFVKNATEAINLVAYSWGRANIKKGDEIVVTVAEHHSNFVPWQQLAREVGATLKVVPVLRNGEMDIAAFAKLISKKTKLATFFHVSNVLGTINNVEKLVGLVRGKNSKTKVFVDGAQAVPHMKVEVDKIGADFYVFTGHKMLAPTGIGVLWAKREILESMHPFMFGGEMISKVGIKDTFWNEIPWKFEAGTPNVGGIVGLGAAVGYLEEIGMDDIRKHEIEVTKYALKEMSKIDEVEIFGSRDPAKRGGVVSFNVGRLHAHDVASILDNDGVAIRSGQHCAEPLMDFMKVPAVARASFYIYNTKQDVDKLAGGIKKVKEVFKI